MIPNSWFSNTSDADEQNQTTAPYPSHPDDKIPKSWLVSRITEESMQSGKINFLPMFNWWSPGQETLAKMQSGDELWSFSHSAPLSSRAGVAIVRNGVVVHAELRMMS